jgi:hypothetical protein
MSRFFVGQRVRKVRGEHNLGLTGTVIGVDDLLGHGGWDIWVRVDRPTATVDITTGQLDGCFEFEAWARSCDWEPILDQHQPADDEVLLRDLDRMASLVGEPA